MRGVFEYCSLCHWEDDGQDDHDADQVSGGPNGDYTLTQARRNFAETLAMFRPEEEGITWWSSSGIDRGPRKRRLLALYDRLITVEDDDAAEQVWREIDACWEEN